MKQNSKIDESGLTLKQKKFIKFYLKYGNATKAALKAYDTRDPHIASVIAAQNLAKLREPVKLLMEKRGLSLGRLLEVLEDGLEADKIVKNGVKVEDHAIRHKYLETAAKWLGVGQEPPAQFSLSQHNYYFDVSHEERENFNRKFTEFIRNKAYRFQEVEAEGIEKSK